MGKNLQISQTNSNIKKISAAGKYSIAPAVAITILLGGIFFGLGKYFEFNSPGAFDSGAYVYSAAHILEGAEIGVDEKPSAQIGTLVVNIFGVLLTGYNEFGVKSIQTIMQVAALVMMFVSIRRLFGNLAACVSTVIAAFCLSAPLIAKFGNVKEQYMIACMVISASCFVLYQLNNGWFYGILTGVFAIWAPLFKPTGTSIIGALGLFVLLQPVFKHRSIRQTAIDIGLIFSGAIIGVAPLYIWILGWGVKLALPYSFIWKMIVGLIPAGASVASGDASGGYVSDMRSLVPFSKQFPIVMRYYGVLILPIALAISSIVMRLAKLIFVRRPQGENPEVSYDRFVLFFAVWWILDMAFVWISPASYEEYYLPLNGSAAMLGGYIAAVYADKLAASAKKTKWIIIGCSGLIIMIILGWHIFFGVEKSPHSGQSYGFKRRGYLQKIDEISYRRKNNTKAPWEAVSLYIREKSSPDDKIYVWGWWPGIYVEAQRFSSAARAFCMPRSSPAAVEKIVSDLLSDFEKEPPKFIVDVRKRDIPMDRPPYELWPLAPKGFMGLQKDTFLPANKNEIIERYDSEWAQMLRMHFDEDEAKRYELYKPLRDFVMSRYRIVSMFGGHILFELKSSQTDSEQQ